jgi:hypothetical protein
MLKMNHPSALPVVPPLQARIHPPPQGVLRSFVSLPSPITAAGAQVRTGHARRSGSWSRRSTGCGPPPGRTGCRPTHSCRVQWWTATTAMRRRRRKETVRAKRRRPSTDVRQRPATSSTKSTTITTRKRRRRRRRQRRRRRRWWRRETEKRRRWRRRRRDC